MRAIPQDGAKDIKNLSACPTDDIQSLYDPFSFTLVNPQGELNYLLEAIDQKHYVPIRMFHLDPFVNAGAPRLWMKGVILNAQARSGRWQHNRVLWLRSRMAADIVRTIWTRHELAGALNPRMAQKLIDSSWVAPGGELANFTAATVTGCAESSALAHRQIRQRTRGRRGRGDAQITCPCCAHIEPPRDFDSQQSQHASTDA